MLAVKPEHLPEPTVQFDRDFLVDHLELMCDSDAWMTLESTLNAAIRLFSCIICAESVIGQDKIQCGGKCKAWFHKYRVRIDRRKKIRPVHRNAF